MYIMDILIAHYPKVRIHKNYNKTNIAQLHEYAKPFAEPS